MAARERVLIQVHLVFREPLLCLLLERFSGFCASDRAPRAQKRRGGEPDGGDRAHAGDEKARGHCSQSHPGGGAERSADDAAQCLAHAGLLRVVGRKRADVRVGRLGKEKLDVIERDAARSQILGRALRAGARGKDSDDRVHDASSFCSFDVGSTDHRPGGRLLPVRAHVVEAVDAGLKLPISRLRPVVFVEPRSLREFVFRDVQHEALLFRVELHGLPGNREELVSEPEEPAEGEDAISDPPRIEIDHVILNAPQTLARGVDHLFTPERVRRQNLRALGHR